MGSLSKREKILWIHNMVKSVLPGGINGYLMEHKIFGREVGDYLMRNETSGRKGLLLLY